MIGIGEPGDLSHGADRQECPRPTKVGSPPEASSQVFPFGKADEILGLNHPECTGTDVSPWDRVERLGDRHEAGACLVEHLHDLREVGKAAGQAVDLVGEDDVELAGGNVGHQPLHARALHIATREAAVVVSIKTPILSVCAGRSENRLIFLAKARAAPAANVASQFCLFI